jgi:virulence-associated protein VagC
MPALVLKAEELKLPAVFAQKISGNKVRLVQRGNSIIITPVSNTISSARGMLKGLNYGTKEFIREKALEKKLENG